VSTKPESTIVPDIDSDIAGNGAEEQQSIEEIIAKAYDDSATNQEATPEPKAEESAPAKPAAAPTAPAKTAAAPAPATAAEPLAEDIDPISGNKLAPINAPGAMPPVLKDEWTGMSRRMQQWQTDRERDNSRTLTDAADARRFKKNIDDTFGAYDKMLKEAGTNFQDHTKMLFEASHTLSRGTQQQRAAVVHKLIRDSLNNEGVTALTALAQGQHVNVQPFAQPVMEKTQADIDNEYRAKFESQSTEKANDDAIESFFKDPKNEFAEYLRDQMGKLIDTGFATGSTPSEMLANAYTSAVQMNKEVQDALALRATAAVNPAVKKAPVKQISNSLGSGAKSGNNNAAKKKMSIDDAISASLPDDWA
jgi:hypothetical protein